MEQRPRARQAAPGGGVGRGRRLGDRRGGRRMHQEEWRLRSRRPTPLALQCGSSQCASGCRSPARSAPPLSAGAGSRVAARHESCERAERIGWEAAAPCVRPARAGGGAGPSPQKAHAAKLHSRHKEAATAGRGAIRPAPAPRKKARRAGGGAGGAADVLYMGGRAMAVWYLRRRRARRGTMARLEHRVVPSGERAAELLRATLACWER